MPETHYYKILDAAPPQPLPASLPSTPLDAQDGFIHLSTAEQTPITADLYFQSHPTLWILRIRVDKLDGRVQIDDDNRGCPHLHDSKTGLGQSNIEEVIEAKKDGHAKWSDVPALTSLPA